LLAKARCAWLHRLELQKCTKITLHILTYRITPDAIDEYYQMGESTKLEVMKCFVKVIKEIFETKYLR